MTGGCQDELVHFYNLLFDISCRGAGAGTAGTATAGPMLTLLIIYS